jgi:hypothetical protein
MGIEELQEMCVSERLGKIQKHNAGAPVGVNSEFCTSQLM